MNEVTLQKMRQMKFYGMHATFTSALETGKMDDYTTDEFVALLIDNEHDDRQTRKIMRNITNARFRYKAGLERVDYSPGRNLDKNKIMRLADCGYIKNGESVLITGSTGVGKSFLASALGYTACSEGYTVQYYNSAKLFTKMKMAKADGSYIRDMGRIERSKLLIIDDFALQPLDKESRLILLDIIEDRHERGAMIFTSQLPVAKWHDIIGEKTVADAILDRIVHQAHRIELKGESMRKKKAQKTPEIPQELMA